MKKERSQRNSRLALRIAVYVALLVGSLDLLLFLFYVQAGWLESILIASILSLITAAIVYYVIFSIQFTRLESLNRITRNIARKRFEDYDDITSDGRDELDYLIKQSIRASKTVEREIQRLNRIENYRKEFIGDISHELKTPIFAIQGFIETLLNGAIEDGDVNRQFLKKAMRNVNRLIFLTKDLMEISKLETGELKSDVQDIYLREVVMDVTENLQYKAQKENVELYVDDFDKNLLVSADRNQIKQVLINLVENAIKYNKPGGSVTVGVRPYPRNGERILVYVEDSGIGIDQKYIDRVTERFFRVDKSRSREKGGTGLGLAIVKHIMEAHGERFFIDSTPNVGSTFSFTLTKVERTQVVM